MKTDFSIDSLANETELEQCNAYILTRLQASGKPSKNGKLPPGPAVTISYQAGSGEHEIAKRLAVILQSSEVGQTLPWTVFDRQLVEKMLVEHHLPHSFAKLMPEERRSYLRDVLEELLGLRPPSWVLVPEVTETILHLVNAGHVILVGRGGAFITARMPNVFHVRLIASLPKRIARVQELSHVTPEEAGRFVAGSDRGRGRYAKTHFHVRVDDDLLYHLAINTDCVQPPEAAELIADGARRRFQIGTGAKK